MKERITFELTDRDLQTFDIEVREMQRFLFKMRNNYQLSKFLKQAMIEKYQRDILGFTPACTNPNTNNGIKMDELLLKVMEELKKSDLLIENTNVNEKTKSDNAVQNISDEIKNKLLSME